MTLLPCESQRIGKGREGGVSVRLPPICMKSDCFEQMNLETHHVVRRSHLGGAYDAVEIDDIVMPNVVTLCHKHHLQITDNEKSLIYSGGKWLWAANDDVYNELEPQPVLVYHEKPADVLDFPQTYREREQHAHRPKHDHDSKTCPRCKGKGKVPKEEEKSKSPRRKYKTWAMGIPVDAGEDGHEIWTTLLDACSEKIQERLGYTDTVPPYYVLIAVASDWLNSQ